MTTANKVERRVFVIMPFVQGGTRNHAQLNSFFENNIKRPIESADLQCQYRVYRSGQSFDITAEIIRELTRADIVIADLSGEQPNPNVMYELGVRLANSERPVMLIREQLSGNRRIFDIYGFYTHPYDPYDYRALEEHLVEKIRRLETGEETYDNPVLRIIREQLALLNPYLTDVPPERQRELVLRGIRAVATNMERAYGPYGTGLAVDALGLGLALAKRGNAIAQGMQSANPFEERGIRLMGEAAERLRADVGDGSKLAVLLAHALVESGTAAAANGILPRDLLRGMGTGVAAVTKALESQTFNCEAYLTAVARTAAKDPTFDLDLTSLLSAAGPDDLILIEEAAVGPTEVHRSENMVIDRGAIREEFLAGCHAGRCTLEDCYILMYPHKVTGMKELLPLLETVAQENRPLLLIAEDVIDEALATVILNNSRGCLRCIPIRPPGHGERQIEMMDDIAAWVGGTVVTPYRGGTLESVLLSQLGRARSVIVSRDQTEIIGGYGSPDVIAARAEAIRAAIAATSRDHDREELRERLARMVGTILTIKVGGATPQGIRERRDQIETALSAVISARSRGCSLGGGIAFIRASEALRSLTPASDAHRAGMEALRAALEVPLRVLAASAGQTADRVLADLVTAGEPTTGFNVESRLLEDLLAAGILDPTHALVHALEVAYATARAFLETGSWSAPRP